MSYIYFSFLVSLAAILFAFVLSRQILRISPGSEKIQEISSHIREGAKAFLKAEFKLLVVVLALVAAGLIFATGHPKEAITFLVGAGVSGLAGYFGMMISTMSNGRCANAAISSFSKSFRVAYKAGAVMGMLVVGLGLLGLLVVWLIFKDPQLLIGYAFGSSFIALFLRVGGGIYTKSADIGADLVGKIEKNIPEDDPRNPAVIADAVGDNVGDVAGMGSDLFESYVSAIIATIVLGVPLFGEKGLILPVLLASAGILASIIGNFLVKVKEKEGLSFQEQTESVRKAMERGMIVANLLMVGAAWFICQQFGDQGMFWALLSGMAVGVLIGETTKYYTSDRNKPVQGIAKAAESGSSINIIEGLSQGMISVALPALGVAVAMISAFLFLGGSEDLGRGLFGIALSSVGILAVLGINLSSDSYGPIVDNAAGIAEMADLPDQVRQKTDALDSVGNSTAAAGKGFAIGSAGLASLAWIATFFETVSRETSQVIVASIIDPKVLGGLLVGAALSFFFCALSMRAVSRGSFSVVEEVRRQFKEIPGLMEGTAKPDYSKTVHLTTKRALKEMVLPGILVVAVPILSGIFLGIEGLGGVLIGGLVAGFLLAVMMSNAGGAWDNAKKFIEAGNLGGKGSEAHKAAVVGDTIGDPMKDTAGPSLNILIKLIGKIAVIFIPLFLMF